MLNLKAKTENETLILKYLELNASLELKAKINNGTKTLEDCWKFITAEVYSFIRTWEAYVWEKVKS